MDNMEKVELLREKAHVTYEEAKIALEQTNWDLLDAIVLLERQGKTQGPKQESYSTSYDDQSGYEKVQDKVDEQRSRSVKNSSVYMGIRRVISLLIHNTFRITRKESVLFVMPAWVFAIILLFTFRWMIPLMIVGLFFGIRYSFTGDELKKANEFMDKASEMADDVKSEFQNRH